MILIMTVEPGFGGQKLIPECLDKVEAVRDILDEKGLDIDLEVDGGVNLDNVSDILLKGANVIVAGSAVFKDDTKENAHEFVKLLNETKRS